MGSSLRAAALFAVLVNVVFFPYLWGGKSLLSAARDIPSIYATGAAGNTPPPATWKLLDPYGSGAVGEPNFALEHHEYLDEHRLPLWNPYQAMGAPQAAAMQQQPFYPLAVPMALAPSPLMYAWYTAARFFVAGFFAFMFLRLFVGFAPAAAGGVVFMLGGYFILFATMPHLSVEVLTPAMLYATESLLRARTWRPAIATAAVVLLMVIGGMPESTLLDLSLAYAYFAFRMLSDPALRARPVPALVRFAFANAAGFGLSAFVLLPFAEFLSLSLNSHDPTSIGGVWRGLSEADPHPELLWQTWLVPMMYGPPWQEIPLIIGPTPGLKGYVGTGAAFLAALAVVAAVRRTAAPGIAAITWFFAGTALVVALKRFGVPPVNWIGALPLFRTVSFPKYEEPLIELAVAVLCALGLAHAVSGTLRRRELFAAFVAVLGALTLGYTVPSRVIATAQQHLSEYYLGFLGALLALVAAAAVAYALIALRPRTERMRRVVAALPAAMVAVLFAELTANYYIPMYFVVNAPPPATTNPYDGGPYVRYLQANTAGRERVIGAQTILQPNWAEAFGLFDVRDNDALYYRRYFPFVRAFLPSDHGAMAVVVNGGYSLADPTAQRLLQLASVKYVLMPNAAADPELAKSPAFHLEYGKDALIYRYASPLPRAAVYGHVAVLDTTRDVLDALGDPHTNVTTASLLAARDLTPQTRRLAEALARAAPESVRAAAITAYASERVDVAATLDKPGLLVLNDTSYPGWNAYVDGQPAPTVEANYLFRGVFLPAGAHQVSFRYEPASYRLGWLISVLALLGAGAFVALSELRTRRRAAARLGVAAWHSP